jgi:hypothetical protein
MTVTEKKNKLLGQNSILLPLSTPQIPSGMIDFCPFDIQTFQVVILYIKTP